MSTTKTVDKPRTREKRHIPGFAQLQRLGKSLMLPIALLPAAGILLRLGQDDLLGQFNAPIIGPFFDSMSAAGGAIFANLPMLFAVGVAIGFAKKADGSTALSAVAGYLVITAVFESMSPVVLDGVTDAAGNQALIDYSVLVGILIGLITAWLFDKYHDITLPSYLGFFGGRRFVPIVVSLAALFLGIVLSYFYPLFNSGLTWVGAFIAGSGAIGAFVYGVVNRMLIPLGLHHIVNTYIWFVYGDYDGPDGLVTGELTRFAAGDTTAGLLTAGFYPILMFGLPAAALAMIHVAKPGQRKLAVGILGAAGLTAFITGVTEPLEFSFMFVAFPLYVIHAVLTGTSLAIAYILDIHLGFSFSAGGLDLLLYGTAPAANNVLLLLIQGLVFAALYYVLFRFAITRFNMRTPGREPDEEFAASEASAMADNDNEGKPVPATERTEQLIEAFGGRDNLLNVDACITRLRIEVADKNDVDKRRLKALGAAGVIDVGNNVQAIFGTQADTMKNEINTALGSPAPDRPAPAPALTEPEVEAAADSDSPVREQESTTASAASDTSMPILSPLPGKVVPLNEVPDPTFSEGLVGYGVAIDPPRESVEAVAPVSGQVVQMWPHAFAILTENEVGILVHLGLDTVQLNGEGFTTHAEQGDQVAAGDTMITFDVPSIEGMDKNPIVPVIVMETQEEQVSAAEAAEEWVAAMDTLLYFNR